MKTAVIGLGAIAPFFLDALDASAELHLSAVCDSDAAKLEPWRDSGVACHADAEELIGSGAAEAIVLTVPNHLHAAVAIPALEAGIHVCCEKPLAVTPADAAAMSQAARRGGATLFTAFHRRYNDNLRRLADALPPRGLIAEVRARYHENIAEHTGGETWYLDPVRCGGGSLIDNGPNALDALRHLLGPLTVRDASIGDVRSGAEFYAEVDLATADGIPVRAEIDWGLATGEVKDVTVVLRDGRELHADMLAGHTGFKASLRHEYAGILDDFAAAVRSGGHADPGPELVGLIDRAYRIARPKERRARMSSKAAAEARFVKLLFHSRDERGMRVSPWGSRCVERGQIHELVTTTDRPERTGDRVDAVGFLGFAEFADAAVVERGDEVHLGADRLGTVLGFDECHAPNHYNILIATDRPLTAADLDLAVGDTIRFQEPR